MPLSIVGALLMYFPWMKPLRFVVWCCKVADLNKIMQFFSSARISELGHKFRLGWVRLKFRTEDFVVENWQVWGPEFRDKSAKRKDPRNGCESCNGPSPPAPCKVSMFVATLLWWKSFTIPSSVPLFFPFYLSLSFLLFFFPLLLPSFSFPFLHLSIFISVPFTLHVLLLSSFHFLSSSSSSPLFLPFSLFFPLPFLLLLWWVDEVCEETAGKDIANARHNLSHGTAGFRFSLRKVRERCCFNMPSAKATILAS